MPANVLSHNSRGVVAKISFDAGTSCMITGDTDRSARWKFLDERYPNEVLKCDVLQTMHHGICGYVELYQKINPEICFWPTSAARFLGYEKNPNGEITSAARLMRTQPFNAYLRDDSIRVRKHYHGEQSVVVDMSDLSIIEFF